MKCSLACRLRGRQMTSCANTARLPDTVWRKDFPASSIGIARHQCKVAGAAAASAERHGFDLNGIFRTRMSVRDYELDQFGVVNNAVFSSYLQHARHEAFVALELPIGSLTSDGSALAISSLTLQFLAPLRSRNTFEVRVWVEKVTAARLVVGHDILLQAGESEKVVVLRAQAVVVFLDSSYRPVRVPDEVRKMLSLTPWLPPSPKEHLL